MNAFKIHVQTVIYVLIPLCLSVLASFIIASIQHHADDSRTVQLDIARVHKYVFELHAMEEEAVAEKHFSSGMAASEAQVHWQTNHALRNLLRADPKAVLLARLQAAYISYHAAFRVERSFLTTGDLRKAEFVASTQVDPAYAVLVQSIESTYANYDHLAHEDHLRADVATTLLLVFGALCLGAFVRRIASNQRAQAVVEAHRSEDDRMRAVLETALDAVVGMDTEGLVIGWNAKAESMFGWSKEEALGRPLADIVIPEPLRDRHRRGLADYVAGEKGRIVGQCIEIEALHRQGHLFPVTMSLSCIRVGDQLTFSAFMSDISERKLALVRLEQSEAKYRTVVDHVKDAIFTTDMAGNWTFLNPAWTQITGFGVDETIGQSFLSTSRAEDRSHSAAVFEAMRQRQRSFDTYEVRCTCKSGETRWIEVRIQSTVDNTEAVLGFFGTLCDITERKAAEERLEHQALHDALTGLPNRLLFQDRLAGALRRMERLQTGIAVLFVDLDNFKYVNDSMGHEAGDILLKAIAGLLRSSARRGDTIARLGGDEFTLLLENIDTVDEATQTAERFLAQLQQPILLAGHEVLASASVGIAFTNDEGVSTEDLLRDADTAMYQAKSRGKSGFIVFNSSMNVDAADRRDIELGLRHAVERAELRVHYQPLVDLETGCMIGVEALVRWEHPTKGLLAPGRFIAIAEETGLIIPIGYWVLEEACKQMNAWKAAYPNYGPFTVNVNLSGKQLQRSDVVETVLGVLNKTNITPSSVKLEITESVMMVDVDDTVAKLHMLKALGVKLAMDDFGTGYSSMASLNLFPLDTVKIDRAFIKRMSEHHETTSIVAAIIMLSKALNLDVTGEGVETAEQLIQLQGLGCNVGQGFLFAKPLPANELSDGIANGPQHFARAVPNEHQAMIESYLRAA